MPSDVTEKTSWSKYAFEKHFKIPPRKLSVAMMLFTNGSIRLRTTITSSISLRWICHSLLMSMCIFSNGHFLASFTFFHSADSPLHEFDSIFPIGSMEGICSFEIEEYAIFLHWPGVEKWYLGSGADLFWSEWAVKTWSKFRAFHSVSDLRWSRTVSVLEYGRQPVCYTYIIITPKSFYSDLYFIRNPTMKNILCHKSMRR